MLEKFRANVLKVPSTHIQRFLYPENFLCGYTSICLHTQHIRIVYNRPHVSDSYPDISKDQSTEHAHYRENFLLCFNMCELVERKKFLLKNTIKKCLNQEKKTKTTHLFGRTIKYYSFLSCLPPLLRSLRHLIPESDMARSRIMLTSSQVVNVQI